VKTITKVDLLFLQRLLLPLLTRRIVARFQCSWCTRDDTATDASGNTCWQTIDVFFREIARSTDFSWLKKSENARLSIELSANRHRQIHEQVFGSAAAFRFVLDCLSAAYHDGEHESVARLVVPRSSGYIVRSDIMSLRLLDCSLVKSVVSFAKPQQFFDGKPISIDVVPNAFAVSIGGMLLMKEKKRRQHIHSSAGIGNGITARDSLLTSLDHELRNRLSFPWLSTQPPSKRRPTLAIVDGGLRGPDDGGTGGSIYTAAEALGIDMVVFDNPGHWVNGPKYCHWRKAFIPLELQLEPDAGFAKRIADAVRSYEGHVDGILTFRDHYKVPVAEAAVQLSLLTYPPSAYAIATDKFRTSVSEGHTAYQASSAEQAVRIVQEHHLDFPLIIKPCNGFLSEGVFRVENLPQLEAGAQAIDTDRHGKEFVIEKYCEGPEVDVNVVLCDGEVIFFEASDDFPKSADVNGHGNVKNFIELANVLPSALPKHEQALLRDSLRQSLIRMGFLDGFFHLEARVENSSMEYATKNHVLDIRERDNMEKGAAAPSAWLIEVNPRPPGIQASDAVKHTYGVDCFGLALLFALNDKHRAKHLSHAFAQGPQYWCEMVFIPVEKGGVYESGDVCEELFARRPDLADHVAGSFCFLKKGDRVSDPLRTGLNSWVAYFNVYSRESRAHVLELADCVRRELTFSIG
jgi:ATP-grasp N-terminal domain/ATP-grasp domain